MFFFSKNFAKIEVSVFEKFLQVFPTFLKKTQYFFLIVFGPLRRVFNTSFGKFREKKSELFFFSKNFAQLFFFAKINFTKISQVPRNHPTFSIYCFSSP